MHRTAFRDRSRPCPLPWHWPLDRSPLGLILPPRLQLLELVSSEAVTQGALSDIVIHRFRPVRKSPLRIASGSWFSAVVFGADLTVSKTIRLR